MSDDRPGTAAAAVPAMTHNERRERQAKDEPPEPQPAGECIVCRGQLVPDMRTPLYNRAMLFGSSMPGQHDGWYCERCGIRYHHLPSHPPLRDEGGIRH